MSQSNHGSVLRQAQDEVAQGSNHEPIEPWPPRFSDVLGGGEHSVDCMRDYLRRLRARQIGKGIEDEAGHAIDPKIVGLLDLPQDYRATLRAIQPLAHAC